MDDLRKSKEQLIQELNDLRSAYYSRLASTNRSSKDINFYTSEFENWVGKDGKLFWVNSTVCDVTGYTVEECLKMPDYPMSIIHESDRERARQSLYIAASQGREGSEVLKIVCKDGTNKWVRTTWGPLYDEAEENLGYRARIEDITKYKRIEQELQNCQDNMIIMVQQRTAALEKENKALKNLLEQRQKERVELEESILVNVNKMLKPHIDALKEELSNPIEASHLNMIEFLLDELTSSFTKKLSSNIYNLTAKQIKIANLIREGLTTKEIAFILNTSVRAINFHRDNIRHKLGLHGKKESLTGYLLSFSE